jgi:hypothetical protein
MRHIICLLVVVMPAAFCAAPAAAQSVQAQYDINSRTVTLDADNADISRVVSTLFARVGGARYEMVSGVSGKVTLHVKNVSPDSALRSALEKVGATWEMRRGVYYIRPQSSGSRESSARQTIRVSDVSLQRAAQEISARYGRIVRVEGAIPGRVSLDLNNATFDEAVRALVNAGGSDRIRARSMGDYVLIVSVESLPKPEDVPAAFRVMVDIAAQRRPIGEVTRVLSQQSGVAIKQDRDIPGDLDVTIMAKREPLWTVVQRLAIAARLKADITGRREITLRPLSSVYVDYKGNRVGSVVEDYGTCPHCRFNELKRGWKYCPMCGERIQR